MKKKNSILILLSIGLAFTELLFFFTNAMNAGEVSGSIVKVLIFSLLILLFSKGITWAKWTLSVISILFGVLYVIGAFFEELWQWYLAGFYDLFFGIYIHKIFVVAQPISLDLEQSVKYPRLVNRYKALLTDSALLLTALILIMLVTENSESRSTIMITSGLVLLLGYEPILTAYSQTIGQSIMKIQVRQFRQPDQKISLINAYVRWFTKGLLGWLSFITINFNSGHRAIHDLASDSIMIEVE